MSDNKDKTDFRDRDRINVNEQYEVQHWSQRFGVSADELKKAVEAAGPMVKDVQARLKK